MKFARIIIIVQVCIILLLNPQAQASPFYIEDGKIFGHKGPDSTISFFVQDSAPKWKTQIHKVFSTDDKYCYFLHVDVIDRNFETNPLTSMVMTLNGQNIPLKLLEWYKTTFGVWEALWKNRLWFCM